MTRILTIFIGPPGSGKGTLSQMMVRKLGWKQVSTGNLCRKNIQEGTNIGKEIDFAIKSGKLVPDELITKMVYNWFAQNQTCEQSIILDGYPRTLQQARDFDHFMKTLPFDIQVIHFILDDETIINRLKSRYICENKECQAAYAVFPGSPHAPTQAGICDECSGRLQRRKDDTETAIKERLKVYHQHAKPLLHFFMEEHYPVHDLKANKSAENLFLELRKMIGV